MIRPREETREAHGQMVRTVYHLQPAMYCDGCGQRCGDNFWQHMGKDWCSQACLNESYPPLPPLTLLTSPWAEGSRIWVR